MVADGDDVPVLHRMLLDQLAVDVRAIGAVQVFQKGIIQNIDDERVMTAHRRIVDTNIVVRKAPDRVALFVHVVFCKDLTIQAEHQACHSDSISLTEPSQDFVKITPVGGERLGYVSHDPRYVVPPAIVVRELYQLFSNSIKISTKGTDC